MADDSETASSEGVAIKLCIHVRSAHFCFSPHTEWRESSGNVASLEVPDLNNLQMRKIQSRDRDQSAKLTVGHHLRSSSLNRALDVVGDWWTQRILRECFLGVRHFTDFQTRLEMPAQTLSSRLKGLVAQGILDMSGGAGYRLTERGLGLYPWALMIWRWARKWSDDFEDIYPPKLTHLDCGHAMIPLFVCRGCGDEIVLSDVGYRELPGSRRSRASKLGHDRRWAGGRFLADSSEGAQHSAFVTADRWTHLIITSVFLGCRSFDVMEREIGIATNILAHRLALLVSAGFLKKRKDPDDARRYIYGLTDRGRDVYPLSITLVQWSDQWLRTSRQSSMQRFHRPCGAPLHARVVCSHCKGELFARRVRLDVH